jgi:hypothetical protein
MLWICDRYFNITLKVSDTMLDTTSPMGFDGQAGQAGLHRVKHGRGDPSSLKLRRGKHGDTATRSERLSSRGSCPCRSDLGARLLHTVAVRSDTFGHWALVFGLN